MFDFRRNPEDSPIVWCTECERLVQVTETTKLMKTVFRVEPFGVFPYAIFSKHNHEVLDILQEDRFVRQYA